MQNAECKMKNKERMMQNAECKMKNEERRMHNSERIYSTPHPYYSVFL